MVLKYRSSDAKCVYPQAILRIGSCLKPIVRENTHSLFNWVIQSSSVVERSAVNRLVVGSNPTAGAILADLVIIVVEAISV